MKIDVNSIEKDIYTKLCDDFSKVIDKKFQRYVSVLEFLRMVEVEQVIEPNSTLDVYEKYSHFCQESSFTPLPHTIFSRTIAECGFDVFHSTRNGRKACYFRLTRGNC